MKKIAKNIILDIEKKEYKVIDENDFILEIGNYGDDDNISNVDDILEKTGIRLNITTYIISVLFL
jgi:hypothetical protein